MNGRENTEQMFLAETDAEESLMLMGRVNALEAIVKAAPETINARMVSIVMGFTSIDDEVVNAAKKDAEYYKELYNSEYAKNHGK